MRRAALVVDGRRYFLTRVWDESLPMMLWIMLNPSIADADLDDPTIRRCIGFAKSWGYGGFMVVNLFSKIATDPEDLQKPPLEPTDDLGTRILVSMIEQFKDRLIVCAWGTNVLKVHGYRAWGGWVVGTIRLKGGTPTALKLSKDGIPCHPLYLKGDLKPEPMPA